MSQLPDLSSSWVQTSSKLIDYAKINGDSIGDGEAAATESGLPLD